MRVTADLLQARRTEAVELPDLANGFDLLRSLKLAPEAHLLVRGDSPIPLDEPLRDQEKLQIISVVSGGF